MTNSEHNDLEKLLKDNLSDKTASVPDFVWDNIEEELFPKKKRRGFFWLFFAGIGLLLGIGTIYFVAGDKSERQENQHLAKISEGKGQPQKITWKPESKNNFTSDKGNQASQGKTDENQMLKADGSALQTIEKGNGTQFKANGKTNGSINSGSKAFGKFANGSKGKTTQIKDQASKISASISGNISAENNDQGENASASSDKTPESAHTENEVIANGEPVKSGDPKSNDPDSTLAQTNPDTTQSEASVPNEIDQPDTAKAERIRKFAVSINGGASLYDMAVFKDYFTSGQLSNRTFASSGFEIGAGFSYQLTPKLGIYTNIAFNRKSTEFNYDLAITESDYFHHLLLGELLPIENIIDNGIGNCFLAKDVKAAYQVDSWMLSLGTTYQILQWKKFTLGADVRFSANLNSSLALNELTVLKIQPYEAERFNYFKTGAGLNLDYRFSNRFSIGIAPMFHLQFNPDKQSFYKGNVKELLLPMRFRFYF